MSAYTTFRTRIVSARHLRMALDDMGFFDVELHDTAQPLENWRGDTGSDKAEVIVRRKYLGKASNDLGFRRRADGSFEGLISDFDQRRYGEQWLQRLTQRYAYHVAKDGFLEQGFDLVEEVVDADQTIRLTLRRMV